MSSIISIYILVIKVYVYPEHYDGIIVSTLQDRINEKVI